MPIYKLPTGKGVDSLSTDISRLIELDGTTYNFRFRWNTRDESWTAICSVGDSVIFSTKVKTNVIFNSIYKHRENAPQGDLVIIDMSGKGGRVDFGNFTLTGRYRLFYVPSST